MPLFKQWLSDALCKHVAHLITDPEYLGYTPNDEPQEHECEFGHVNESKYQHEEHSVSKQRRILQAVFVVVQEKLIPVE